MESQLRTMMQEVIAHVDAIRQANHLRTAAIALSQVPSAMHGETHQLVTPEAQLADLPVPSSSMSEAEPSAPQRQMLAE